MKNKNTAQCEQCGNDSKCDTCCKCQKCGYGCYCTKLKVFAYSMATGCTIGLLMLALGLLASYHHTAIPIVSLLGSVYKGFEPTWMGALYGTLWGFGTGFVMGLVLSSLYNGCLCCFICRKKCGVCNK